MTFNEELQGQMKISKLCMRELWFECFFEYYPYIQMWQYMFICEVGQNL